MELVGNLSMLVGAGFVLLAAVGLLRFDAFRERIHPATKSSTLGILLLVTGAALHLGSWRAVWPLAITGLLTLLTAPVAGHLLGRASYMTQALRRDDGIDELARDLRRSPED